ncbi:MAG: hypothetical protein J6Z06_01835, partial [Lachnospiraceae bacterium]|nr:hypothetical protein [Lachnospiraceae bacterium]
SEVSLREFGCYIYDVEAYIQEQALIYDAENPTLWWNTHFSAGPDSAFISDYAKRSALDMCACTEIYVAEANQKDIALDASEEAQATSEAEAMYTGMSVEQRKSTGLTLNDVTAVKKKRALAAKYVTYLSANTDFTGYPGTPQQELNWDGSCYKQFIMPLHTVKENEKLLEHITFGTITVNME